MEHVGNLGSGEPVYDRPQSHTHNGVSRILSAALAKIQSEDRKFLVEEVDFGQPIGETVCVVTGFDDEIVFAKRLKRLGYSRFVKKRSPEPCNKVVVILKKDEREDYYVLITTFIGYRPEPEPWDRNATEKSVEFWDSHALIWRQEEIIPGTETGECPW